MNINPEILRVAVRKAKKSMCHTKVAALGFNNKGDLIMKAVNRPRFSREGGGVHAEMRIMHKRPNVKTILLCRVNSHGIILPLDPCNVCAQKAKELGITIITVRRK
jgi:hypothetical protein